MKTYLTVLLQNCLVRYTYFKPQLYFSKANLKSSIHRFKLQGAVTFPEFVSTISNLSPLNFKKVFCKIQNSFQFKELIPESVF